MLVYRIREGLGGEEAQCGSPPTRSVGGMRGESENPGSAIATLSDPCRRAWLGSSPSTSTHTHNAHPSIQPPTPRSHPAASPPLAPPTTSHPQIIAAASPSDPIPRDANTAAEDPPQIFPRGQRPTLPRICDRATGGPRGFPMAAPRAGDAGWRHRPSGGRAGVWGFPL